MLATLAGEPFSDPEWLFEIKWDGVRALAEIQNGRAEFRSRTGREIDSQYPELKKLAEQVRVKEAMLDGEIVAVDEKGRSDFERLQARINVRKPSQALLDRTPVIYYIFDILYCDGYDLRAVPLLERKRFLRSVLDPQNPFFYADHQLEKGEALLGLARRPGLEGIIGKHLRSTYTSGRSPSWVKLKIAHELDAVVGGYTSPRGSRENFGALLVGLYEGKTLRFVGGAGTGFNRQTQQMTYDKLTELKTRECPFKPVPRTSEKATWVQPHLVARLKYANWTQERRLRASVFVGLRDDHPATECRLETELSEAAGQTTRASGLGDRG